MCHGERIPGGQRHGGTGRGHVLIRDGGFDGADIHLFEEQHNIGGSLDAGGTADAGYTMRGGRMFEAEYRCTYDLLSGIPSLDDPSVSLTQEILAGHQDFAWDDIARLVDGDGNRSTWPPRAWSW